jgi:hypothetical protein
MKTKGNDMTLRIARAALEAAVLIAFFGMIIIWVAR